jgi:hypothetical protein
MYRDRDVMYSGSSNLPVVVVLHPVYLEWGGDIRQADLSLSQVFFHVRHWHWSMSKTVCSKFQPLSIRYSSPEARLMMSVSDNFCSLTLRPSCNRTLISSEAYLPIRTCFTDHPRLFLSASCALIHAFAYRLRAICSPPGEPALILPPRYHGFSTRSKE